MSRFNLAKKLLPAKKAWKSFKTTFQSKLQKIKTSKAIKTTKICCIQTLNSIRVFVPHKLSALVRRLHSQSQSSHHFYCHHQQIRSSSVIYIDELFPGHPSTHASHHSSFSSSSSYDNAKIVESTSKNVVVKQDHQITAPGVKIIESKKKGSMQDQQGVETSASAISKARDAWKIPLMPQLRCVDERAEEFISKFRQEMKLQREQSIIDFQEMLARGC